MTQVPQTTPAAPDDNENIVHGLGEIRQQIEQLNLPRPAFVGIEIDENEYCVEVTDGHSTLASYCHFNSTEHDPQEEVAQWLADYAQRAHVKLVAAGVCNGTHLPQFASLLWLKLDITPIGIAATGTTKQERVSNAAHKVREYFNPDNSHRVRLTEKNEVITEELVTLNDYQATTSEKYWKQLLTAAQEFRKQKQCLLFINATPQGGGVAIMRHGMMRLMRLLDLNVHWHVLIPRQDIFEITKTKFHNMLQAMTDPDVRLTDEEKAAYTAWSEENAHTLQDEIKKATTIVIDDPQPAGLIPHIKQINPKAKIMYRSHIQVEAHLVDTPGTPQNTTWEFLWQFIKQADLFISHPIEAFIPKMVSPEKTVLMPPAADPLNGLNKKLTSDQEAYYLKLFNKILLEHHQTPLDLERPYIIQAARFDPSKGIADVIEAYRLMRENLKTPPEETPQLLIVGHGSIDDPDGVPIYNLVLELVNSSTYKHLAHDIKVARLPYIEQLLDALMRKSTVALQLSHKEGFEFKVTEAQMKGVPIIAYKAGGIPLQIKDGVTGFLVDVGNEAAVAQKLQNLLTDTTLHQTIAQQEKEQPNEEFMITTNMLDWLWLATHLADGITTNRTPIEDLRNQ